MAAHRAQPSAKTHAGQPHALSSASKAVPLHWTGVLKLADTLQIAIQQAFKGYLDLDTSLRLLSVSDEPVYFWEIQDYYVGQNPLSSTQTVRLRLSTTLCDVALTHALGAPKNASSKSFALNQLQPFEVFLLEQFSRNVFEQIKPAVPLPNGYDVDAGHGEQVHFHWVLAFPDSPAHEPVDLVLSFPYSLIAAHAPAKADEGAATPDEPAFTDDYLMTCYASGVTFRLGSSKIRIQDIDDIAYEDVVILENSRLDAWYLWDDTSQYWVTIPVRLPIESEIPRYDPPQGESNPMKHVSPQSMSWENLQVDLVATFQPMKLPIKRLKELSEGLVLEVTGLMDNQITLCVDGQPVAYGELVVVGDKFAVRVQGLYKPDPTLGQGHEDERQYRTVAPEGAAAQGEGGQGVDLLKELDLNDSDFNDGDDDWS